MSDFSDGKVCSKIMSVFKTAIQQDEDVFYELGKLSDVISTQCPHSASIWKLWEAGRPHDAPAPELWSVEISYLRPEQVIVCFLNGEPIINCDINPVANDDPEHPGTSILPDPQWVDPLVPKYWYSQCLDDHGPKCAEPDWIKLHPGTNADSDWLIDVTDQCIVPFSSDTSIYVTLSYTWGFVQRLKTTTGNLKQLRGPGSIHPRRALNIPRTIRDATGVTALLGERYLWVDSLCIVQDDNESLSKNLNAMHRIYANSNFCLVAHAGTDANLGLRGLESVSAPKRLQDITWDIAGGERLASFIIFIPTSVPPQTPKITRNQLIKYRHTITMVGRTKNSYSPKGDLSSPTGLFAGFVEKQIRVNTYRICGPMVLDRIPVFIFVEYATV